MTTKRKTTAHHEVSVLAAIRWYANTIESLAIQKYFGKISRWPQIDAILTNAIEELQSIKADRFNPEPDCPWPICPNDICAPTCARVRQEEPPYDEQ